VIERDDDTDVLSNPSDLCNWFSPFQSAFAEIENDDTIPGQLPPPISDLEAGLVVVCSGS